MGKRNTAFYVIGFYLAKVSWLLFFSKLGVLIADTALFSENSAESNRLILGEYAITTFLIAYVSLIFIGIVLFYGAKLQEVKRGVLYSQVLLLLTVIGVALFIL